MPGIEGGFLNESSRGTALASQSLLDRLRSRGYTIESGPEVERYLDERHANAATFLVNDLLLRHDARTIEVLEEYLHNVQRRIGLTDKLTPFQMDIHVKEFMVRHQATLAISDSDAGWLRTWLGKAHGSARRE